MGEVTGIRVGFWRRVADSSVALLIAVAMLVLGFYWHRQAMEKVFQFLTERVLIKLDRIESKIDDLKK
jgi:hypothetical protein